MWSGFVGGSFGSGIVSLFGWEFINSWGVCSLGAFVAGLILGLCVISVIDFNIWGEFSGSFRLRGEGR